MLLDSLSIYFHKSSLVTLLKKEPYFVRGPCFRKCQGIKWITPLSHIKRLKWPRPELTAHGQNGSWHLVSGERRSVSTLSNNEPQCYFHLLKESHRMWQRASYRGLNVSLPATRPDPVFTGPPPFRSREMSRRPTGDRPCSGQEEARCRWVAAHTDVAGVLGLPR